MVKLQCSLSAQNCRSLYLPSGSLHKLPYTSQSCVNDTRLQGNVGRCGFPGAPCVIDGDGNDNCAQGGDDTVAHYTPLCQNGVCGGGLGATCFNGDYDCNWGYYCNSTYPFSGVCGGQGAFVSGQLDTVDNPAFPHDYCLSGSAYQASDEAYYCSGGVLGVVTSSAITPTSTTGRAVVIAIIAFFLWRRSRRNKKPSLDAGESALAVQPLPGNLPSISDTPISAEKLPLSPASIQSRSTLVFNYLPEVQDDSHSNAHRAAYPSSHAPAAMPASPSFPPYAHDSIADVSS
ncbi:hypothetical protein GALMADRAFT_144729 [Galerina marginata CBS 339.88]|uniref:Uncharacterized protein n=1 Tax=Galerina marginata (strain CBS 339.88) TaxID=685588 RepID=A0A067SKC9_GALM3|nr:hypothetical protein GALMADRAFT_144729 [Galerina marginata CBS 339.88]